MRARPSRIRVGERMPDAQSAKADFPKFQRQVSNLPVGDLP